MTTEMLATMGPIGTDRLAIRPLTDADAPAFAAMTDDPSITDIIHFLPTPFAIDDATRLIVGAGDGRDCFFGVWRRDAESWAEPMIGTVGAHLRGEDEIEIGYWFAASARGQGLALEAVSAVIKALAADVPGRRIYAECRTDNRRSWRLLERAGFHPTGNPGDRPGRVRLVLGNSLTRY